MHDHDTLIIVITCSVPIAWTFATVYARYRRAVRRAAQKGA